MASVDDHRLTDLVHRALSVRIEGAPHPVTPTITAVADVNRGRGVFSSVVRADLAWPNGIEGRPRSVVIKIPAAGPNGDAGRGSGAYRREAEAYRSILPNSPIRAPHCHLVDDDPHTGDASFVLEDLTPYRAVDQMAGLPAPAALAVTSALRAFHDHWTQRATPAGLRANTPATLAPEALDKGIAALATVWAGDLDPVVRRSFERLVDRRQQAVAAFTAAGPPTLCHGDPRADNVVFADQWHPIVFDWQQIAIQAGAADIAWLAATSTTVEVRRTVDHDLIAAYGTTPDAYRAGLVLPGLAVLLLAQRHADSERTRTFIATSLHRIGHALSDWDVGSI
ncbi:MAG: phosphotransferase [Actinomycetota bacterium]